MLTSKRAIVPRRSGTGRQTAFRSFAVSSRDFDCLTEQEPEHDEQENAGASPGSKHQSPTSAPAQAIKSVAALDQQAADAPVAGISQLPLGATTPAAFVAAQAADMRVLSNPGASPYAVAGVVLAAPAAAVEQPIVAKRLLCSIQRPWHSRGSGRMTKKHNFSTTVEPLEQAEQRHRAALAAAAAAEAARVKAAAEAAARAEAEAQAQALAARQAEEEARAAAEAEEAARLAAEAAAAAAAAREEAEAAARAEAEAQEAAEARAAAAAEQLARAAAEAAAQAAVEAATAVEAEEAARLAAEAEAAIAAVVAATPAPLKVAQTAGKTPGSSFAAGWSPIEGIPEMHTRPRPRRAAAAAAAATPARAVEFTPMEGVPETARGFRRSSAGKRNSKRSILPAAAYTPIEGVPEKDFSFQRTPFDKQLHRVDSVAAAAGAGDRVDGNADLLSPGTKAAAEEGVTAAEMAAALQQVDSMVAGIVSASPNTPITHPLPVYLSSLPRSQAAAAAAASVYRHEADKPGHMNVAIQYSAGRSTHHAAQQGPRDPALAAAQGAAIAAAADQVNADVVAAEAPAATASDAAADEGATGDDVAAALWDDDGDEYAGAGGDYDSADHADANQEETPADNDAAAAAAELDAGRHDDQELSFAEDAAGGSGGEAAVNSHSAGALSPPPRLTPEPVVPAASSGAAAAAAAGANGAAAAARRRLQSVATPREGRQAKNRKSLAGDGLVLGSDGRRVSRRQRHKPLEYWRNENKEYVRDHRTLPTVKRYVSLTPDPVWPAPSDKQAKKARTKLNQQQQQQQQQEAEAQQQEQEEDAAAAAGAGTKRGRGRPAGKSSKKAKR